MAIDYCLTKDNLWELDIRFREKNINSKQLLKFNFRKEQDKVVLQNIFIDLNDHHIPASLVQDINRYVGEKNRTTVTKASGRIKQPVSLTGIFVTRY